MNLVQAYDYISVELEEVRELFDSELQSNIPIVMDMLEEVGKFRGKMLRPILVLLCGKACGEITKDHHVIAAVSEMVHMATLVHDDVLDEAESRRRGKTINSLHGNEAAVMLGDLLISHAFHLCSSIDSQIASRMIAATTNTVCEGELMQLYYRGFYDLDEEKYIDIISRKTASLIAVSCYLGAQASGANETTCQAMEEYGWKLGVAFQIMDDIVDITGTEESSGKTLGIDMLKEKLTLPVIHFLSNCNEQEKQWATQVMSDPSNKDHQIFVDKLMKSGSLEYAHQKAVQYVEDAKGIFPHIKDEQTKSILLELAGLVVSYH